MNDLDTLARRAGSAARDNADPTVSLDDVHRASRRRTARNAVGGVAAAVALVAVGASVLPSLTSGVEVMDPAGPSSAPLVDDDQYAWEDQPFVVGAEERLHQTHGYTVACWRATADAKDLDVTISGPGRYDRVTRQYLTTYTVDTPVDDELAEELEWCGHAFEEQHLPTWHDSPAGLAAARDMAADVRTCLADGGVGQLPSDDDALVDELLDGAEAGQQPYAGCRDEMIVDRDGFETPTSDAEQVVADGEATRQEQRAVAIRQSLCLDEVNEPFSDVSVSTGSTTYSPLRGTYDYDITIEDDVSSERRAEIEELVQPCRDLAAPIVELVAEQRGQLRAAAAAGESLSEQQQARLLRLEGLEREMRRCLLEAGIDVPDDATTAEQLLAYDGAELEMTDSMVEEGYEGVSVGCEDTATQQP